MLQNSGLYGPNDVPINMGSPTNMSQLNSSMSLSQGLNAFGKIPQQLPQPPTTPYNMPNYSNFSHHPYGIGPPMSPYSGYPSGYHSNYMAPNPNLLYDNNLNSVSNGMMPINLHAQSDHCSDAMNYSMPYEKRQNPNEYRDAFYPKNVPLNIPHIQTKPIPKHINSVDESRTSYCQYNQVQDSLNEYPDQNLDLSSKPQELSEKDKTRQRLEKTVRIIENIINSSSKTKECNYSQQDQNVYDDMPVSKESKKCESGEEELTLDKNVEMKRVLEGTFKPEKKLTIKENLNNVTTKLQKSLHEPNTDYNTDYNKSDLNNIESNNLDQRNSPTFDCESESLTEDSIGDEFEPKQQQEEQDIKPIGLAEKLLDNVTESVDVSVMIKVENLMSWTDTDYPNPFHRDSHCVSREEIDDQLIVESENSVNEALDAIKNECDVTERYYECPYCNIIINNPKRFLIHTKWHTFGLTNDKRIEMAKEKELKRTMKREAREIEKENSHEVKDLGSEGKKFPCKDCDKVFNVKSTLKNHRQRIHPTKSRDCKICKKTIVGWMAMRAHLATHYNETAYQCSDCPKRFKYAHSLAKHRDTHLEKTHPCTQCDKKFGSQAQLSVHMKTHERILRGTTFRCTYCAKGFYESYNLQVHERTHRNERPFQCHICNTSYGTNSSLQRHLKVSHCKSKPYECSTCHRCFSTEVIRDRHELRLHGDPEDFKFLCKQCPCKYLRLKDLQKHLYKVHPKGKRKRKAKAKAVEQMSQDEKSLDASMHTSSEGET